MILSALIFSGCVRAPVPLVASEGNRAGFNDPAVATITETVGSDTGVAEAPAPCELSLATSLYLDPTQELRFCAPDSEWMEGDASYEATEDGVFFAFASFGTWVPGDNIVAGGETEVTIIGDRGPWVAEELVSNWQVEDLAAGYEVGEMSETYTAGLEGYAFSAAIPAGANDSFPSGGTMIYAAADLPEGVLTFFAGYGQYPSGDELPMYLSLTWDEVTAADITAP